MNNLQKSGLLSSLGVLAYVAIVGTIMNNGDRIFGQVDNWLAPIAFLLLFTLSALVVCTLLIGKPITLYIDGKKKDAISLLLYTGDWLALLTLTAIIILFLIK